MLGFLPTKHSHKKNNLNDYIYCIFILYINISYNNIIIIINKMNIFYMIKWYNNVTNN